MFTHCWVWSQSTLLTAWSFSITCFNFMLKRCKLGLKFLLSQSINLLSSCFQHSTLLLSRNLLACLLPSTLLHWTLQHLQQSSSLPSDCGISTLLIFTTVLPEHSWSCGGLCDSWMTVQHQCCECGQSFCVSAECEYEQDADWIVCWGRKCWEIDCCWGRSQGQQNSVQCAEHKQKKWEIKICWRMMMKRTELFYNTRDNWWGWVDCKQMWVSFLASDSSS